MHYSGKRTTSYTNARPVCDETGKLTALEFDIGCDLGVAYRGLDSPQCYTSFETLIDMLAKEIKVVTTADVSVIGKQRIRTARFFRNCCGENGIRRQVKGDYHDQTSRRIRSDQKTAHTVRPKAASLYP